MGKGLIANDCWDAVMTLMTMERSNQVKWNGLISFPNGLSERVGSLIGSHRHREAKGFRKEGLKLFGDVGWMQFILLARQLA